MNAHARRLLERVWDTAADTGDERVLGRINLALSTLVGRIEQVKGALARAVAGGGFELRLRLPGNDAKVVPLTLVAARLVSPARSAMTVARCGWRAYRCQCRGAGGGAGGGDRGDRRAGWGDHRRR